MGKQITKYRELGKLHFSFGIMEATGPRIFRVGLATYFGVFRRIIGISWW